MFVSDSYGSVLKETGEMPRSIGLGKVCAKDLRAAADFLDPNAGAGDYGRRCRLSHDLTRDGGRVAFLSLHGHRIALRRPDGAVYVRMAASTDTTRRKVNAILDSLRRAPGGAGVYVTIRQGGAWLVERGESRWRVTRELASDEWIRVA
ncbi:hypothetical protein CKO28_18775 [Rhodovibrio sodomensis]|uniref:Uncharacterized protein n=1 Tax=Rhodovibrio sodomensis TaxID=1088 RepID=A0ABS1DKQ1_9PROT|nr:hypothetical protein [Rhodovibrio sodomensis]MBK1670083.1 hypothetical protein [Rhodovibrio sodomensis]